MSNKSTAAEHAEPIRALLEDAWVWLYYGPLSVGKPQEALTSLVAMAERGDAAIEALEKIAKGTWNVQTHGNTTSLIDVGIGLTAREFARKSVKALVAAAAEEVEVEVEDAP